MVRCKFRCTSVTKQEGWSGHKFLWNYKFTAVMSGSEENQSFFAATPNGDLSVTGVKDDLFEVGKEYYLDITESEAPC